MSRLEQPPFFCSVEITSFALWNAAYGCRLGDFDVVLQETSSQSQITKRFCFSEAFEAVKLHIIGGKKKVLDEKIGLENRQEMGKIYIKNQDAPTTPKKYL